MEKEKTKIAVIYCDNYDRQKVYQSIQKGLKELGGIGSFVSKEEKILVKPNFLYPSINEKAITTHSSVIEAVLRILNEEGYAKVKVGDSGGSGSVKLALEKGGFDAEKLHGASPAAMNEEVSFSFKEGKVCRQFIFTKDVVEADAIIGLSKMKTHMLERITGAVKNMYGLVCGANKPKGHVKYNTAVKFAKLLCDIHNATPQRLHIMDGIVAMEGNGPSSGRPTPMNLILVSKDPVAIDTIFARLVYLNPQVVPTIVQGQLNGLGTADFDNMEIVLIENDNIEAVTIDRLVAKYGNPDFDVAREKDRINILSLWSKLNGGSNKPAIDSDKCVRCGICVNHCPVEGGAVHFVNGKGEVPVYDYRKCIRCYCCQELCPQHAIYVKKH